MLTTWLTLVLAAAVAPWPLDGPSTPPDAPEELYTRLESMTPPARQQWVQTMLARLDRANQVVMNTWEVRRQHTRVETAMQPFVEGKPDWRRRAETLNHELRARQQAAVERLSREYRVEVYNTWRGDRLEYDRRLALLTELVEQWTDAGALPGQEHKVVDWLLSATGRTGAVGELPAIPRFAPEPAPAASIAVTEPPKVQPPATAPVEPKPAPPVAVTEPPKVQPPAVAPVEPKPAPPVAVTEPPKVQPPAVAPIEPKPAPPVAVTEPPKVQPPAVAPVEPKPAPPVAVTEPPKVQPPITAPVEPKPAPLAVVKPSFEAAPKAAAPAAAMPTPAAPGPATGPQVAPAGEAPSTAARQPAAPPVTAVTPAPVPGPARQSPPPVTPPAPAASPSVAGPRATAPPGTHVSKPPVPSDVAAWSLPAPLAGSPRAFTPGTPAPAALPSPTAFPSPTTVPAAAPKAPAPTVIAPVVTPAPIERKPGPAALPAVPKAAVPAGTPSAPPALASRSTPTISRPSPPAVRPETSPSQPRTRVDPDKLAEQILGNNLALQVLAAELDQKKDWDSAELDRALRTLEPLVIRKDDLTTARDLLSADELARVGQPASPSDVIAAVTAKVLATRNRVEAGTFSGTQAERQAELERLDALSARLDALVFEHP